ncbi:histidine phosphatase family protein [Pseudomonas sp. CFBP13528]|uniref:Histidine phosphatase family protein n=1 Tax=Pseudomonas fluorescens TaxID=294 RepID=A0A2N1E651_PSEFL|nr:histidine phosphatase family protein [Pseudomonas fluorescens]TKK32977.1 histidine phosphatase family protein [Pseudomonas sp. CFBP13528]
MNNVADITLTKPRRARLKRLRKFRVPVAGIIVIALLLNVFIFWPRSPQDLGIGNRLVTSGVLASWRNGDLIVLVRHEERCDRSGNPCYGPADGLTVNGTQRAADLGSAFESLGMERTDVLSSPTTRTAQTSLFMFGKTELSPGPLAICGDAMGEEILSHKQADRNLMLITHSACMSDFQEALGYPHAQAAEYGSALFVQVLPDGKLKALGTMKRQEWAAALKQL